MKLELRDYQRETVQAILQIAKEASLSGEPRRILTIQPTGAGKTVIILSAAWSLNSIFKAPYPWKSLIVVPSVKLVEQTIASANKFFPNLTTGQIGDSVFSATPETMLDVATAAGMEPGKLTGKGILPDKYQFIVIDESHHSPASTYQRILDYFTGARVAMGCTATFKRGDGISVASKQYFPEIISYNTIGRLTDRGFLCPAKGYLVHTNLMLDLQTSKKGGGDFTLKSLEKANTPERNQIAVDNWFKIAPGEKTIAFAVSVNHAKDLAKMFADRGVAAAAIWGSMPKPAFEETLAKFRAGEIRVLTNCLLLIEGFDEPSVSCVLIARPATVASLCVIGPQMCGRALRLFAGKTEAKIIELRDLKKDETIKGEGTGMKRETKLGSAIAEAFDIDELDLHLGGGVPLHEKAKLKKQTQLQKERQFLIQKMSEGREEYQETLVEFFDVIENVGAGTLYSWIPLGNVYFMDLGGGNFAEIVSEDNCWTVKVVLDNELRPQGFHTTLLEAFRDADMWITRHCPTTTLIGRSEPWRDKPASVKQVKHLTWLARLDEEYCKTLTSGQASDLIVYHKAFKTLIASAKSK